MLESDLNSNPRTFEVNLPLRMGVSKKKMGSLNLNIYRNLHHYELSFQKRSFSEYVKPFLKGIPELGKVNLQYRLFYSSKRRIDIMNFGSVVDKYFSDTLVEAGIIEDDDSNIIDSVSFAFGGYSENDFIQVIITETQIRGFKPMQITLNQADIEMAVNNYILSMGIQNAGSAKLVFDKNTVFAEVLTKTSFSIAKEAPQKAVVVKEEESDDDDIGVPVEASEDAPKKRRGRKKGSKNKATLEAEVNDTDDSDDDLSDENEEEETEESEDVGDTISSSLDSDNSGSSEPTETRAKKSSNPFETPSPSTTKSAKDDRASTTGEGKKSKNLFGEPNEESSKVENTPPTSNETNQVDTPKTIKSIFDE